MISTPITTDQTEALPQQPAFVVEEAAAKRQLDSKDLFMGARQLSITHNDQTYLLRLTRQNKLILTK